MPHRLLSAAARLHIRLLAARTRVRLARGRFWRWEFVKVSPRGDAPYQIFYAGTKEQRSRALALFGLDENSHNDTAAETTLAPVNVKVTALAQAFLPTAVLVSEAPVSGALRVPWWVNAPVPLKRPLDDILATYSHELRRRIRKQRGEFRVSRVINEAEIVKINKSMLEDYAEFTHGGAVHFRFHTVRRIALGNNGGRLDLVEKSGERVACHLGYELKWDRKRYWVGSRFGYPESVFKDRERRGDINSMNIFLAMEWALQNGYDYYDLGGAAPHPENGLLQWKRRRGGGLDLRWNEGYFFLRLPKLAAAQLLWDSPLFAAEKAGLVLHLGLPLGPSDKDVAQRYCDMGFAVAKVYLHCARPAGEPLLESLKRLYVHLDSPPAIEVVPDPRA